MIPAFFLRDVYTAHAMTGRLVLTEVSRRIVKDGFDQIIPDGGHEYTVADIFCKNSKHL